MPHNVDHEKAVSPASSKVSRRVSATGIVSGAGVATLTFPTVSKATYLERIGVAVTGGATFDVSVYVGSVSPGNIMDYVTGVSVATVGDQFSPIYIPPNTNFVVVVTNATAAETASANVQYEEVR